jgi:nucleotide-binding universal stress UspA family protein
MVAKRTNGRSSLKTILVATDFSSVSPIVLAHAVTVARRYKSKLYVAHVIPPDIYTSVPADMLRHAVKETRQHVHHEMSNLLGLGGLRRLRHQVVVEEGEVADVLLKLAQEQAIDLLVIGTRGHRGVKRLLLGSVAEKVFRQARCPVLIVPPAAGEAVSITRILYPTDFSKASLQAAPYAFSLARHYRAKLILLHVFEGNIHSIEEQRLHVQKRLKRSVLRDVDLDVKPELAVEFGEPAERIRKAAAEWQASLIVLAVRRDKPKVAHLAEGIAYKVVRQAPCPVLTVRRRSA